MAYTIWAHELVTFGLAEIHGNSSMWLAKALATNRNEIDTWIRTMEPAIIAGITFEAYFFGGSGRNEGFHVSVSGQRKKIIIALARSNIRQHYRSMDPSSSSSLLSFLNKWLCSPCLLADNNYHVDKFRAAYTMYFHWNYPHINLNHIGRRL